ncbi:MAG: ATP-binding protein [Bacteroidales bacterium]|nr:ATP-binding protein [Bacteroidales bacterium]
MKYPIGIQTFSEIREKGYFYIDKTEVIFTLINSASNYIFLNRPRRFGKSLLCSTLRAYFEGRRDLFKGLALDRLATDWTPHPVVHLSLGGIKTQDPQTLRESISYELGRIEKELGLPRNESWALGARLKEIITTPADRTGQQTVVIIDEYDNPLLNVIHLDQEKVEAVRQVMSELYAPLKDCDPWLRFVFITGITKFSQMSIFSCLNNIENISMLPEYASICGITLDQMLSEMAPDIEALAAAHSMTHEQTVERLRVKYDGYAFSECSPEIFNPFSLLNCFKTKKFGDFWFATGTPTALVQVMRKYDTIPSELDDIVVDATDFDTPTELISNVIPLMYQSGYLTIKGYKEVNGRYILGIPNQEVRVGLMNSLLPDYVRNPMLARNVVGDLIELFSEGDIEGAMEALKKFFATVPYCSNIDYEGHWQQMLYVVFSLLGAYADVEVRTREGRVDIAMAYRAKLYLIEVKLDASPEEALAQIERKQYAARFQLSKLPLVKVGINFSTTQRGITGWLIK